ncbi:MAG: hypothetical protein ACR2L2_07990 [Acidobacteriota bacterium]
MFKRIACALVVLFAVGAVAAASDRWLHVRVESFDKDKENVRINLPLSLVEQLIPAIETKEFRGGRIQLGKGKLNGIDLRRIITAVNQMPDSEFVTVQTGNQNVRVAKANGYLTVTTDGNSKDAKVNARIPMAVVTALVSGGTDELDLLAAIRALSAHGDGELVTVDDKDNRVRVWIDGQNTSK